ncbi:MAG: NUDIX domain-containing protein [Candidatus Pacearchaeota archaeon]|jgi:ADP-ribose pyrophosphatase YjhB (NUDIX family)
MKERDFFKVVLVGMIYDPKTRKILIGKGNLDPNSKTGWCFPGGILKKKKDIDKRLKAKIKEQTGYKVANLGTIFTRIPKKEPNTVVIFFLCEIIKGQEKPAKGLIEIKWINPSEAENYFTKNMNSRLKEYFMNLDGSSFK